MGGTFEVADRFFQLTVAPGINCWAIVDDQGATLVDAGYSATYPTMRRRLRGIGVKPQDVRQLLLTHGHADHAGGAAKLVRDGTDVQVLVGRGDVELVRGDAGVAPSDASTRAGRVYNAIPGPVKRALSSPPPTPSAQPLAVDELDLAGGCTVVPTPGHSPGHCAFHFPQHDVVIAGDVVFNWLRLGLPLYFVCSSLPANDDSILKVADLEAGTVLLAHGGPLTEDPSGALRQFVADRAA